MTLRWTSAEDVTDRWVGTEAIPADDEQIERLLADAEDTILGEFPDLEARLGRGEVRAETISRVAARLVIRHLRNPSSLRSVQTGTGPFSGGITYGGDTPGELALTEADRAALRPAKSQGRRAFSVMPSYRR